MYLNTTNELLDLLDAWDVIDQGPYPYIYDGYTTTGQKEYTLFYRDASNRKWRRDYLVVDESPVRVGPDHDVVAEAEAASDTLDRMIASDGRDV